MTHAHFIEWLRSHLDNKSFGGCRWIERSEQTFKISWPRADRTTMRDADTTRELLGIMYGWWTHKFGNTRINDQPTAIKGNFRSCLNSKVQSLEIRKVVRLNETTEADTWKAYQFTEPRDKKGTPGKGKKHTSSVSSSAYRDTEMTGFEADIETDSIGQVIRYSHFSDKPVKMELDSDDVVEVKHVEEVKKGPTLKVLVNQAYPSGNNQFLHDGRHSLFSPTTSPTTAFGSDMLFKHVQDKCIKPKPQLPVGAVEPIIRIPERSYSSHQAAPQLKRSVLEPPRNVPAMGMRPKETNSVGPDVNILRNKFIQELLTEVYLKSANKAPVASSSQDSDTLSSFLSYIGKEMEKLPPDFQHQAKQKIFYIVQELKKQSHIPHHWLLAPDRRHTNNLP